MGLKLGEIQRLITAPEVIMESNEDVTNSRLLKDGEFGKRSQRSFDQLTAIRDPNTVNNTISNPSEFKY